ncbi:MAG: AMIN domain-containing protein, partial [Anderseniella sp.]
MRNQAVKAFSAIIRLLKRGWPMVAAAFVMLAFIHLALSPIPVNAAQPKLAEIRDARLAGDASRTRFVADLDTPLSYSVYVVSDPYRVIVDMPGVRFILPPDSGDQGKGLVKSYRFGLLEPGKSRIVLDTTGPVLIEKSFVLNAENGQPARMVIDMVQTDQRTFARIKANELPEQASQSPEIAEQTASETEQAISVEQPDTLAALLAREGVMPLDQQASSEADQSSFVPKPRPKPDSQSAGHEEKAPETPNAKPVIVLDPGHGGIDG